MRTVAILLTWCFVVHSAPEHYRVTSIPGYSGNFVSKQYSGYVDVGGGGTWHMHYWFVESERDPSNDPVVVWVQGGPGASGLYGMFIELGPFRLNDLSFENATTTLHPLRNPYGWQKVANVIFIESPLGIGFSYCDGKCPLWSDNSTAEINFEFLVGWYKQFPEYAQNELYIVGESYGGIYVPTLVDLINKRPQAKIPLKGFGIGDGCVGDKVFGACGIDWTQWSLDFMYGHSAISRQSYVDLLKTCGNSLHYGNFTKIPDCSHKVQNAYKAIGGYYMYYWFNQCWGEHDDIATQDPTQNPYHPNTIVQTIMHHPQGHVRAEAVRRLIGSHSNGYIDGYKCGGNKALKQYLNQPDLQAAIHVPRMKWVQYDNWPHYNYTIHNTLPFYPEFIPKYRIMIYNADADPGVMERSAEEWVVNLGLKTAQEWRPWTYQGKQEVYGYVTQYEPHFDFVTVKGAGHMVPLFRPRHALAMISNFLDNTAWPVYVATPSTPFGDYETVGGTVQVKEVEDPATASFFSLTPDQLIKLQAEVLRLRQQTGKNH